MKCFKCQGKGYLIKGYSPMTCPACKGTGEVEVQYPKAKSPQIDRRFFIASIAMLGLTILPLTNSARAESKLEEAIKDFRENIHSLQEDVSELNTDLKKLNYRETVERDEVTEIRMKLEDIVDRVGKLKTQLKDIEREAKIFFSKLRKKTENIKTSAYYARVSAAIDRQEELFLRKLREAKYIVSTLELKLVKAKDLIVALEILDELKYADVYINRTEHILTDARYMLSELDRLIAKGDKLVMGSTF
ncbi:DnaJ-like cysteine-rich domain-containing protein [Aquifex sp.]